MYHFRYTRMAKVKKDKHLNLILMYPSEEAKSYLSKPLPRDAAICILDGGFISYQNRMDRTIWEYIAISDEDFINFTAVKALASASVAYEALLEGIKAKES